MNDRHNFRPGILAPDMFFRDWIIEVRQCMSLLAEIEGCLGVVLSSNWIEGKTVYWPRKNSESLAVMHVAPSHDWKQFQLIKIKFSSGNYNSCIINSLFALGQHHICHFSLFICCSLKDLVCFQISLGTSLSKDGRVS